LEGDTLGVPVGAKEVGWNVVGKVGATVVGRRVGKKVGYLVVGLCVVGGVGGTVLSAPEYPEAKFCSRSTTF
jgi:hypothetical protein